MQPELSALLDRSIADLQQLAMEFARELEVGRPRPGRSLHDLRRKEALLTISVLLPKLAAVRRLEPEPSGAVQPGRVADRCRQHDIRLACRRVQSGGASTSRSKALHSSKRTSAHRRSGDELVCAMVRRNDGHDVIAARVKAFAANASRSAHSMRLGAQALTEHELHAHIDELAREIERWQQAHGAERASRSGHAPINEDYIRDINIRIHPCRDRHVQTGSS